MRYIEKYFVAVHWAICTAKEGHGADKVKVD
jgi:hypothetical protein